MNYDKEDAQMTRGLAVICMVVLHLFCRQGDDVFGMPLLWLNDTTPLVYLFGFFSEICVPLYSICAGYAQQLLYNKGKSGFLSRGKRILRLMVNYWIVLVLFSVLALISDPSGSMPGSLTDFLKSLVLLHSYNGAWWYLNTYVLLLLLPPALLLFPVQKLKLIPGMIICTVVHILWYLIGRVDMIPSVPDTMPVMAFVWKEIGNLIGILAYVWAGGFLCKYRAVARLSTWFDERFTPKEQKWVLFLLAMLLFIATNIVHKWVAMGPVAVTVFLLFNLWRKSNVTRQVMLFLGKHSTNIWLTHMFFYAYVFKGLVLYAKYPVLMFVFMLLLCITASCVIMLIQRCLKRICHYENSNHHLS